MIKAVPTQLFTYINADIIIELSMYVYMAVAAVFICDN